MRKADALKRLQRLAAELDAHLKDYGPSETFISHDLLVWLRDASRQALDSPTLTIGQALSLEALPNRPAADDAESIPPDIYKAWFIHQYDQGRQHRKKQAGKSPKAFPRRLTWPRIAGMVQYRGDPNELNKQVHRYQSAIARVHAERFFKRRP